jgi:diguanylate cyclase (GGDEF)-like protein
LVRSTVAHCIARAGLVGLLVAGTAAAAALPTTKAEFEAFKKPRSEATDVAYQAGDIAKARRMETEMLALSRKFGDKREEVSSVYGLALMDTVSGELDSAEARFRQTIPMWQAISDQKGLALSLRGLGRVLEAKGRLPEAAEVQVAGLELLLKFGKPIDQSESYYSLARLFMNLESYPAALKAVDQAIALMGPTPPDFPLGLNLAVRADVLRELGRLDEARASAQGSYDAFARGKSPIGEAIGQLTLGKIVARMGELERGLVLLRDGEAKAEQAKEGVLVTDLQFAQGMVLVAAGRFEDALVPLDAALANAERLKLDQSIRNVSLELEKAYSGLGRPADALAASKRAFAAQTRLASLEQIGNMAGRSAETQLSAVSSKFLSLDAATRASAPVLAAPKPPPAPTGLAAVPRWVFWAAGLVLIGVGLGILRMRRLRAEGDSMRRAQADLASAHAELQDHSAQLAQQVSIDPLTGVLTRRAFTAELAALLDLARAASEPVSLAVFDLDHFKQVNDRHGHLTGDAALRLLVGLVREQLDSEDLLGRFGGDEFLLASRVPVRDMQGLAERIRAAVEERSRAPDSGLPPLSISLGLAEAGPGEGYDAEALFHRADTALYAAKAGGRNRVEIAQPAGSAPARVRSLLQPATE